MKFSTASNANFQAQYIDEQKELLILLSIIFKCLENRVIV